MGEVDIGVQAVRHKHNVRWVSEVVFGVRAMLCNILSLCESEYCFLLCELDRCCDLCQSD